MKKNRVLTLLLLLVIFSFGLASCGGEESPTGDSPATVVPSVPTEKIDYAGNVTLDMDSNTKKAEVTVKLSVDGDTVHFNINEPSFGGSLIKARFLAVNTPESTGQIEPYGKKASDFTKAKLKDATSIIVESDDDKWNADSTGGRFLLWIWYREDASSPYRNLNIELLQEGLSIASNSGQNRYGETCMAALNQAKILKLNCFSGQADPDFYYGDAKEITLKELRINVADYVGQKVAFEGVVFRDDSQTAYVEEFFEEDGIYYGIAIYYGFTGNGKILEILEVGNRVRIVGTVSEFQGTYQVSGLEYERMKPNSPNNIQKISSGHKGAYPLVSAEDYANKVIAIETENEDGEIVTVNKKMLELSTNSSISMNNLEVVSVYTTTNPESDSNGAMTLTCKVGDITVEVRTIVLRDSAGKLITASTFQGKNINVKGMIEFYDGGYQIKLFSIKDVTFN